MWKNKTKKKQKNKNKKTNYASQNKNEKKKENICFMHVSCLYDLFLRGHNIFTTGFHIYFWEGMQNLWCGFLFFSREAAWKATFHKWCISFILLFFSISLSLNKILID